MHRSILWPMRGTITGRNAGPRCLPETMLHEAWRLADGTRARVTGADGNCYKVLYSGMPGGSYGPDFRQAVLEREDGSEVIGDVEIHVRSREWYTHGHAEDGRYCGVKLHGVWSATDGDGRVVNAAGLYVPQIGLSTLHERLAADRWSGDGTAGGEHDGAGTDASGGTVEARIVRTAGDEWFAEKVAMFDTEIDTFGGDLAVQLGVFEALGYARNRWQFRTLARRVPWHYLKRELLANDGVHDKGPRDVAEGLLRWGAGFDDAPAFASSPVLAGIAPDWNRASGMPANRPERRVSGAAALAASWHASGGPLTHTVDAVRSGKRCADIWRAFASSGAGIGQARAREIVINVVLPLVAAWAKRGGDGALYAKAVALYAAHPSMGSNSLLRESLHFLTSRGFGSVSPRGARNQQGAIHLYKSILLRPRPTRQPALPAEHALASGHG